MLPALQLHIVSHGTEQDISAAFHLASLMLAAHFSTEGMPYLARYEGVNCSIILVSVTSGEGRDTRYSEGIITCASIAPLPSGESPIAAFKHLPYIQLYPRPDSLACAKVASANMTCTVLMWTVVPCMHYLFSV